MNHNDQNFEQLKKLLKLKQHEVPPPGYFNNFSSEVISRIRAGEAAQSRPLVERLESQASWLYRLLNIFELRSGVIGGVAASLCLLLLLTVIFAEHSAVAPANLLTVSGPSTPLQTQTASASLPANPMPTSLMATAESTSGIAATTNPVVSLAPSIAPFGQPASSLFRTASFVPNGK